MLASAADKEWKVDMIFAFGLGNEYVETTILVY